MKRARCKFTVESVKDFGNNTREIVLKTLYDEKLSKEDQAFFKYTPSGQMIVQITNPNVFELFVPGEKLYIDITRVSDVDAHLTGVSDVDAHLTD